MEGQGKYHRTCARVSRQAVVLRDGTHGGGDTVQVRLQPPKALYVCGLTMSVPSFKTGRDRADRPGLSGTSRGFDTERGVSGVQQRHGLRAAIHAPSMPYARGPGSKKRPRTSTDGTRQLGPAASSWCRCRATRSYARSRSARGTSAPTRARVNHPPRYFATRSAASERTSTRSGPRSPAGSTQTTESTHSSAGCLARTADPNSPCNAAKRRVCRRSCRSTSWTLSAQKPQVPS